MSYREIDFNKVKGFNKLTQEQQELFKRTYERHNSCHGNDYKADWAPVSVRWIAKEYYLKVVFENGEWLHYTTSGNWY